MKKTFLFVMFVQILFLSVTNAVFPQCGTVANDLSMILPCVKYEGTYYKLSLSVYKNPSDPSWIYWKFDSIQPAITDPNCAHADTALTISAPCVYYAGKNIAINLEYYLNPVDPGWPYWKLGSQLTVNPVDITSISGDTLQCIDMSYYSSPAFQADLNAAISCMTQCGEDVTCLMSCMPDLGLGSAFSLAFELDNPEATPVEFTLPAGSFFQTGSGEVQPMLVAVDETVTVPPGVMIFCVPTYCMDVAAHAPSEEDVFSIAGIAQQACIAEIVDLVRGKEIDFAASSIIQEAVWDCIENGSISQAQQIALQNL